jgi:putative endonuclease
LSRRLGAEAEARVRRHFRRRGYKIVGANEWAAGNEIDLVVRRGRRLIFCEVKMKSGEAYGDPLEMVTGEKARRVRRAAEAWLVARPALDELDVSLEVVSVRGRGIERTPLDVE